MARAGGVPISALLIGHPRPRVGGPGRPAAASGGQLPGQGVGEGPAERARCGAGGWGRSNAFGAGVDGAVWPRVVGRWRPICPALLLEGLALRGWLGAEDGRKSDAFGVGVDWAVWPGGREWRWRNLPTTGLVGSEAKTAV